MRISDWSSDVCSSDLTAPRERHSDRVIVKTNIECGPGHPNPCVGGGDGERMPLVMCDIEPGAPCEQTPATSAISAVYGNCTAEIERYGCPVRQRHIAHFAGPDAIIGLPQQKQGRSSGAGNTERKHGVEGECVSGSVKIDSNGRFK